MFWIISVVAMMFLWAGIIYFISATRYINFQKARYIRFDQEAAEWKEREEDRADALMEAMGMSAVKPEPITGLFNYPGVVETDAVSAYPDVLDFNFYLDNLYGEPKNGRSLFPLSNPFHKSEKEGFNVEFKEEPGDPEVQTAGSNDFVREIPKETFDFEESGGRKKDKDWINFVRTYWSESFNVQVIIGDKMVYPTSSEAIEAALRTAHHLGLTGNDPKISHDYSIDENLNRVIVEWITEKPESEDDDSHVTDSDVRAFAERTKDEMYKNAIEKTD